MQLSFNATFNLAQGSRNLGETPSWPCALIPKELKSMKMRYSSVWTSRRFSFCSALVKSGTPWRPVKLVSINHYTGSVMKTFRCVQQNSSNEVLQCTVSSQWPHGELTVTIMVMASRDWIVTEVWPSRDWTMTKLWLSCDLAVTEPWSQWPAVT